MTQKERGKFTTRSVEVRMKKEPLTVRLDKHFFLATLKAMKFLLYSNKLLKEDSHSKLVSQSHEMSTTLFAGTVFTTRQAWKEALKASVTQTTHT